MDRSIEASHDLEGKKHGPGIAIMGGCGTYLDPMRSTFLDNGTILYVGFSNTVSNAAARTAMYEFCEKFFTLGATVNEALDAANAGNLFNLQNRQTSFKEERNWMWAMTYDGKVYDYDSVEAAAEDGENWGRRDIGWTYEDVKAIMEEKERELWNSND